VKPMQLTFDEADHIYRVNGRVTPSVTQVLHGAGFVKWDGGTAGDMLYGKASHKMVELDLAGTLVDANLDPGLKNAYLGWKRFQKDFPKLRPCVDTEGKSLIERPMHNPEYDYSGTPDLPMTNGRTLYLLDLKNSACSAPHWGLQLVGYVPMVLREMGIKATQSAIMNVKRLVIRLSHLKPEYSFVKYDDPSDYNYWIVALNAYRWKVRNGFKFGSGLSEYQERI